MQKAIGRSGSVGVVSLGLAPEVGLSVAIVAVAALYYLIGGTAPSLLVLVVLAALCWRYTDLAIPLIPLAAPLFRLPKHLHIIRNLDFSLAETAIVLCTAIVVVQQAMSVAQRPAEVSAWRHFVPPSPFELPALAFLLAAALATLAAHFHTVALREFREVILEPMLFYWLILQRVRGALGALRLVLAVVAAGVAVAIMGVIQLRFRPGDLANSKFVPGAPLHLVRAVYGDENNLALLLDKAIPMALALVLAVGWLRLFAREGDERLQQWAQGGLLAGCLVMLVVLYKTTSRGGELTLAVCAGVLFALWQWRRPAVVGAGVALAAAAAFVARNRIADAIGVSHGNTTAARPLIWQSGARMIRDHPLFGVGPDNFLYYYSNDSSCAPGHIANFYYTQRDSSGTPRNFERCLSHPHNLFLDFWVSTGVLGLLAGLALLGLFAVLGIRAYRQADASWRGPLLAALLAMLALVVHGQVDNSYFLADMAVFFWLCLGVVALCEQEQRTQGIRARSG